MYIGMHAHTYVRTCSVDELYGNTVVVEIFLVMFCSSVLAGPVKLVLRWF